MKQIGIFLAFLLLGSCLAAGCSRPEKQDLCRKRLEQAIAGCHETEPLCFTQPSDGYCRKYYQGVGSRAVFSEPYEENGVLYMDLVEGSDLEWLKEKLSPFFGAREAEGLQIRIITPEELDTVWGPVSDACEQWTEHCPVLLEQLREQERKQPGSVELRFTFGAYLRNPALREAVLLYGEREAEKERCRLVFPCSGEMEQWLQEEVMGETEVSLPWREAGEKLTEEELPEPSPYGEKSLSPNLSMVLSADTVSRDVLSLSYRVTNNRTEEADLQAVQLEWKQEGVWRTVPGRQTGMGTEQGEEQRIPPEASITKILQLGEYADLVPGTYRIVNLYTTAGDRNDSGFTAAEFIVEE